MRIVLIAVTLAVLGGGASAQTLEVGAVKAKLIGRVQAQFNTTSVSEAELLADSVRPASPVAASTFETRRVRFGAELDMGRDVTGKIEVEYGMARLQLRDVWFNYALDEAIQFKVGQWKKPFSLLQLYSSTRWPVIERSVRIRGLGDRYTADDRARLLTRHRGTVLLGEEHYLLETQGYNNFDLGAAVLGKAGAVTYEVGVFNGTGTDAFDDTNGKAVAGRLTLKPLSEQPLVLGAAFSRQDFRVRQLPRLETRAGTAFEADLEWGEFRKGLHLLAEATTGRNLALADTAADKNFAGVHAVFGWFVPVSHKALEGVEPAGRISWGDPRRGVDGDEGLLLTPGFNLYWSGRNRLMFNWDVFRPAGSQFQTEHALRVQAQIAF